MIRSYPPVKINYQLSAESVGTITGWLIQEMTSFKLHPESYISISVTESILRNLCVEFDINYDKLWSEIDTVNELEVLSDI